MTALRIKLSPYKGLVFGLLIWAVRPVLGAFPELVQSVYQNGLFRMYRLVWDYTLGYLPFALIIPLLALITLLVVHYFRRSTHSRPSFFLWLANGIGVIVGLFYMLWGYNYLTPGMRERMNLVEHKANDDALFPFAEWLVIETTAQRDACINGPWMDTLDYEIHLPILRASLEDQLAPLQFPTDGRVQCRIIHQNGVMRRLGISGIYLPFTGEGHVDGSASGLTLLFAAVHEMSHGYGVTDEGEANFAAWLALSNSPYPLYHYLGNIELLRYVLYDLYRIDFDRAEQLKASIAPSLRGDLEFIRENARQYPGWFPQFSEAVNDMYLRTQGVESGIESYDEFVQLAMLYSTTNR